MNRTDELLAGIRQLARQVSPTRVRGVELERQLILATADALLAADLPELPFVTRSLKRIERTLLHAFEMQRVRKAAALHRAIAIAAGQIDWLWSRVTGDPCCEGHP